jgi:hypothetical protein
MGNQLKGIFVGCLKYSSFVFSMAVITPYSKAVVTQGWSEEFIKPCVCDSSFEKAFPKVFANRVNTAKEAKFLKITTDLIKGFVEAEGVANSKKHIYWTVYELGAFDIVNALVEAKRAGVQVVVVTDGKSVIPKPASDLSLEPNIDLGKKGDDDEIPVAPLLADRHLLTKEAFKTLKAAKIPVAYSDPEFKPVSTPYPPIMHEKIRLFAVEKAGKIVPTFAYISTHNDTYSETIGDPLTTVPLERLKEGQLTSQELDPRSKGNVQTAFILRHSGLLYELLQNTLTQVTTYKNGKGRIFDIPMREPTELTLGDGTRVQLSFTYARKRPTFNPNEGLKNFISELNEEPVNSVKANIHLQQFVFSYGGASEVLKDFFEKHGENVSMDVWVDGNFALEAYSQARKMSGMYTVLTYRKDSPIEYPWKKSIRQNIDGRTYANSFDKLHTKNTYIKYRKADQAEDRYFIMTGSLNLSSNGVSNKELFFVIDTPSRKFIDLMESQAEFLRNEGFLKPIDDTALFQRIKSTAKKMAGVSFKDEQRAYQAYDGFLKVLEKGRDDFRISNLMISPMSDFSNVSTFRWVNALATFLENAGAEQAITPLTQDLNRNLKEVNKFYPSVPSVEILLHLSDQKETVDPKVRNAILDLFSRS